MIGQQVQIHFPILSNVRQDHIKLRGLVLHVLVCLGGHHRPDLFAVAVADIERQQLSAGHPILGDHQNFLGVIAVAVRL